MAVDLITAAQASLIKMQHRFHLLFDSQCSFSPIRGDQITPPPALSQPSYALLFHEQRRCYFSCFAAAATEIDEQFNDSSYWGVEFFHSFHKYIFPSSLYSHVWSKESCVKAEAG